MTPTICIGALILTDPSQQPPRIGDGICGIARSVFGMIKSQSPLPNGSMEVFSHSPLTLRTTPRMSSYM